MRRRPRAGRTACSLALVAAAATVIGAQRPPRSGRELAEHAREAVGKYRAVANQLGLVEIGNSLPPDTNAEDLAALCRSRERAIEIARANGTANLAATGTNQDPLSNERRAVAERYLAAVSTYVGDVDQAIQHFTAARDALSTFRQRIPRLEIQMARLCRGPWRRESQAGRDRQLPGDVQRRSLPVPAASRRRAQASRSARRAAVDVLHGVPEGEPDDLEVRWLLNLAYMLLGRYPAGRPAEASAQPDLFRSERDDAAVHGRRRARPSSDATTSPAARSPTTSTATAWSTSFFTSVDYCAPARLYRNSGDGTFEDRTDGARLLTRLGGLNAIQTDYNNDGRLGHLRDARRLGGRDAELAAAQQRRRHVHRRDARGRAARMAPQSTHSRRLGGLRQRRLARLFVGHELSPSQLFRNSGDGTFEDVTARAGVGATAFTKGVVAGDYDNDGYPDLYVSNMFGDNFLFHNKRRRHVHGGREGARRRRSRSSASRRGSSTTTTTAWLDIFVVVVSELGRGVRQVLPRTAAAGRDDDAVPQRRQRHVRRTSRSRRRARRGSCRRWAPTSATSDNDGFLDMYLGTGTPSFAALMPNIMLRNDAGRRFLDVTAATGTGHLQKGHGIAFVDIDNDGDEDVMLNIGGAVPGDQYTESLFENPGSRPNTGSRSGWSA